VEAAPVSPWMSPRLYDRPVPAELRLRYCRASRTCVDEGIGEHVAVMRYAQRPIDPFFYEHSCRPHVGLDLTEVPDVGPSSPPGESRQSSR
jgi:hypothetical protein